MGDARQPAHILREMKAGIFSVMPVQRESGVIRIKTVSQLVSNISSKPRKEAQNSVISLVKQTSFFIKMAPVGRHVNLFIRKELNKECLISVAILVKKVPG